LVLFALFWGGSLVAQGLWYQDVAPHLVIRSAGAAVLVGSYCVLWVALDRRSPGKYDTLFEFQAVELVPFNEFEAVRWISTQPPQLQLDEKGQPVEIVTRFRKGAGQRTDEFAAEQTKEPFKLNGINSAGQAYMTVALRVPLEADQQPVRFEAILQEDSRGGKSYASNLEGRRFVEVNGQRYILADRIGTVYIPTPATVMGALLLNFLLFIIWWIALWPIMQFEAGHAAGLTLVFGFATMLLVMPLLFQSNRVAPPAHPAAAPVPPTSQQGTAPQKWPIGHAPPVPEALVGTLGKLREASTRPSPVSAWS
jgi:hypothetical protein